MTFEVKNMLRDAATETAQAALACEQTRTEIRVESDGALEDDCALFPRAGKMESRVYLLA